MKKLLLLTAICCVTGLSLSPAQARDPLDAMLSGESYIQGKQLDKAMEKAAEYPFGSAENPVRASMPPGERAYLDRLRCEDGSAPDYERGGSVGQGPYGNIMDVYDVRCGDNGVEFSVYMDMYHKGHVEAAPVSGFTIVEP